MMNIENLEITRVKRDVNGNSRLVVHFLDLVTEQDRQLAPDGVGRVAWLFDRVLNRCRKVGGKRYRGREVGGGIVFQESNEALLIHTLSNLNG